MVGSSMLALPWAFSEAGIILGILICLVTFLIGYYTCSLTVKTAANDEDFADTCFKWYGEWGWRLCMGFSFLLIFAAIVIYYEYMSQGLFPILSALIYWILGTDVDPNTNIRFNSFSLPYTCIVFSCLLYPMISKRDLQLFISLGSYGIVFVTIIMGFIFSFGIISFSNTKFVISNEPNFENDTPIDPDSDTRNISLINSAWPSLAGMMCLGYYLHNCVLPIV